MSEPLITIRDLRYRYADAEAEVLRIPFLDISGHGLIAITGPSGVGKTTLVELLAGTLHEAYEGSVQVLGKEWQELRRDADRQRQLRRIGLIPQDFGLLPSWTPQRTLEQDLSDAQVPAGERTSRVRASLAQVGLSEFAGREIGGLSGGQGQRVAIARMLARDVELVIADEPTANLDPQLVEEVGGLLKTLAEKVPVIVVTHDPRMAEMCDRTIVLQAAAQSPREPTAESGAGPSRAGGRHIGLVLGVAVLVVLAAAAAAFAYSHSHRRPHSTAGPPPATVQVVLPVKSMQTTSDTMRPLVYPPSVTVRIPSQLATSLSAYGVGGIVVVAPKGWQEFGSGYTPTVNSDGSRIVELESAQGLANGYLLEQYETDAVDSWPDAASWFPWARTHWNLSGAGGTPPPPGGWGYPKPAAETLVNAQTILFTFPYSFWPEDAPTNLATFPAVGLVHTSIGPTDHTVTNFDFIEVVIPPSERSTADSMVSSYRALQGY